MTHRNPVVYYGKKLLIFVVSVLLLSIAVFYISRLAPSDPLMSYYGERVEKNERGGERSRPGKAGSE